MDYKQARQILKEATCYECSYGTESMESCTNDSCTLKVAIDKVIEATEVIERQQEEINALVAGQETLQKHFAEKLDKIVEQLEAEKYRGMESLEPVLISFNFGINKAIEIVKGGAE